VTTLREASDALVAVLEAVPNLLVFVGGVPDDEDLPRDDDGHVKPYAAIYLGGGQASSDRYAGARPIDGDTPLDLSIPAQVTAAAGTYRGGLWAADMVRGALTGVRLFNNLQTTRLKEVTDPGPIRKDQAVPDDLRWYLPMQYRFATTT
jgi:hypothetical protein